MIARIHGEIAARNPDSLIVDVNGVGYLVYAPAGVIARAKIAAEVTLHTCLVVREDAMTLYGFTDAQEQRLFQTLIAVNGVGPKLASRIVLDLRDKLTTAAPIGVPGVESEEVVAALMGLGYSQAEAADAVARSDLPSDAPIEEKVRLALAHFARTRAD